MAPKSAGNAGRQRGKGRGRGGVPLSGGAGRGHLWRGAQQVATWRPVGADAAARASQMPPGVPTRQELLVDIERVTGRLEQDAAGLGALARNWAADVEDTVWLHAAYHGLAIECRRRRIGNAMEELANLVAAVNEHLDQLPEFQEFYDRINDPDLVLARQNMAARTADIVRRRQVPQPAASSSEAGPMAGGVAGQRSPPDAGGDAVPHTGATSSGTVRHR